jgi:hypothetical protein
LAPQPVIKGRATGANALERHTMVVPP